MPVKHPKLAIGNAVPPRSRHPSAAGAQPNRAVPLRIQVAAHRQSGPTARDELRRIGQCVHVRGDRAAVATGGRRGEPLGLLDNHDAAQAGAWADHRGRQAEHPTADNQHIRPLLSPSDTPGRSAARSAALNSPSTLWLRPSRPPPPGPTGSAINVVRPTEA